MGLSYDIISEFVKVTNGNKEKPKEGIVYATIVQASDGKYVKIDGSDLLTPTDTTTDIEDGERVTVMIKDHRATVTGNVTAPSASGNRVDKVVETVTEQIGVFETVVADKVSVNELEAYKATIENLIVGKADIEDLEATNAVIENLKVKDAEIENAIIDKADIEDLEAVNAVIENLKVKDAEIENLVADKATINDLNAVNADIQNLKVKHAQIEDLVADKADIEDLEAVNAVIEDLKVKDAEIENAVVDNLEATKAEIGILNADFAEIKTLVNGNLTSDNISSFNITAGKVTMEDAFIKDAMIDTVNAAKINAGRINTNSVVIGSEDGGMRISGATQQFTDKNGNVRIQIGRDASNDFTFALYGEDGQGQLINQNGITASAIADGLIVNDMVSDNAAISGGKLDISSVVTEINNDNTTTINSNKIYLDEQNQSLEVAFKSLKTQVDTIKDIDSDLTTITDKVQSNTSKIEANKSSISTLLAEDAAIKRQVTDLEGNVVETTNTLTSKYTSLQQNLDGFKTTVNNTYATKTSVNDVKNNLSSNYSTTSAMNSAIQQKVDAISASVSSTYATKNEVKTIDNNIKANYSTTEQMSSAISVAKNEINLGISQVYETKTEVTNKVGDAINKVQIGGRNLIIRNTETKNYYIGMDGSLSKADGYGVSDYIKVDSGESLAFSKKDSPTTDDYFRWAWYGNDKTYINRTPNNSNKFIWVVPSGAAYVRISYPLDCYPKVERGTKHTDWIPAPEDVDTSINNAITTSKNYTDSQIKISKDAIELGVSKTYETKTSVTSQISNTLTSAKSYADTKKSEAISTASSDATSKANNALNSAKSYADTKKSEAITSANNTLNSTIANYYTKAQTDSQIKIAKDAINLGVSQTYETKTNVTSKVNSAISTASSDATSKANNALTSAKSYADTKKSEAITSANNTLNSTIANYYTKAQTDSQIKIAKDSITSSVSSTYETKTNVQNKIDAIQVGGRNLAIGSKTATNDLASGGGTVTTASDLFGGVTAVKTNTAWSGRYFNLKAIAQRGGFKVGDKLVLSVYIKSDQNVTLNVTAHRTMGTGNTAGSSKTYNNFTVTPTWKQVWFPFVADAGTLDRVDARIEVNTATNTNYIYWAGWKLEKGTVGTDWSPAPEDVDNTISSLSTRVSTAEQKITSDAIVSTVTSSATYKNNLTGKVDKTTIISSINQTAESVKINASKIELTGSVVVNAINSGSTTINGSKITTGTISANSITSGTFKGTNFEAGGSSNGNGYIKVQDASNNILFQANKDGIYSKSIEFALAPNYHIFTDGVYRVGSNGLHGETYNDDGTLSSWWRYVDVDIDKIRIHKTGEYETNTGEVKIQPHQIDIHQGTGATTQRTLISRGSITMTGNGKKLVMGTGGTDVYIHNNKSGKYIQLKDDGRLTYSDYNILRDNYIWVRYGSVIQGANSSGTNRNIAKIASHGGIDLGDVGTNVAFCSANAPTWWNGSTSYKVYTSGSKPTPADIGAAKALVSANGYQGMTLNDGSTSNWIRTTTNGLLPSASSGSSWPSSSSSLGTSSWRFSKGYVKEMYVNGLTNDLGDIWLTAKAGANTIYAQAKWLCPATSATTYLGSSGYRWHSVWAANGTIQTSDERFKVKQGFVNIDDCFEMIKNTDIYNYIMLNENKEKLSKNRLGKMAMENSKNDVNTHIGIMAQDIQKYECSKGILIKSEYEKEDGTVDTLLGVNVYGLATAVMGGLKKEIQIRDEQYECLKRENEELKTRLANIERMLMQTLD